MEFLHSDVQLGSNDLVIVTLDAQANVMLLDESNFSRYRSGKSFSYFGGPTRVSPCRLRPPRGGRWHVVVDLGGYAGSVAAGLRVIRN